MTLLRCHVRKTHGMPWPDYIKMVKLTRRMSVNRKSTSIPHAYTSNTEPDTPSSIALPYASTQHCPSKRSSGGRGGTVNNERSRCITGSGITASCSSDPKRLSPCNVCVKSKAHTCQTPIDRSEESPCLLETSSVKMKTLIEG